jgi:Gram-negative bacterial TonB protein C-terminal
MMVGVTLLIATSFAQSCAGDTNSSTVHICLAEEHVRLAKNVLPDDAERLGLLERAAEHYRRAADLSADVDMKRRSLDAAAQLYDVPDLNNLPQREQLLSELVALSPDDVSLLYRLAKVQEDQGLWDIAEGTLAWARQKRPEDAEPYKMLSYFFHRRAAALTPTEPSATTYEVSAPGEPDERGVYRVGPGRPQPLRVSGPSSIVSDVIRVTTVEIVIDERGVVTEARPGRGAPARLADAAAREIRQWRYTPTILHGRAVPVKMRVNVVFR